MFFFANRFQWLNANCQLLTATASKDNQINTIAIP